ncbi:MAG: right-handed parallel beta-helix repeat-containing protein [Planctomycetaceae bacterium]
MLPKPFLTAATLVLLVPLTGQSGDTPQPFSGLGLCNGQTSAATSLILADGLDSAIKVPADVPTIQAAIDQSQSGQVVLVAPGTYQENLNLAGKSVQLVSEYVLTGDVTKIGTTIIDGGGRRAVIRIPREAKPGTRIVGLTIRNGSDGIAPYVPFDLLHCHVTGCGDGIDYEGGGGLIRGCKFWANRDDAIDLDGSTAATIESCQLIDNGDDGIEIRLHRHTWPRLNIVIRNNAILRNGEDGIQLIGYEQKTARRIRIERNFICNNRMAGIGLMDGADTREDLVGAGLPELLLILHNTFVGNDCHITGGANVLCANNIFASAKTVALRNMRPTSLVVNNLVWNNATDTEQTQAEDSLSVDPRLNDQFQPAVDSPAVNKAIRTAVLNQAAYGLQPAGRIPDAKPDLGAYEVPERPAE